MMGLTEREIDLDDIFIITCCGRRTVALVADAVEQVVDCPEARYVPVDDILPSHHHFNGFARLDGGVTLIHDLETCLCPDEAALVDSLHVTGAPA
jgi:purine-binding chemotaxis protein CheW